MSSHARAVHTCPWAAHLRVGHAAAALQRSPKYAPAVGRTLSVPALEAAARRRAAAAANVGPDSKVRCVEGGRAGGRAHLLPWCALAVGL